MTSIAQVLPERLAGARAATVAGLLATAVAYSALAVPLLGVPLREDETLWSPQAHAVLERGAPKVLFDEWPHVYHPDSFIAGYGADYGLWHTPAYFYLLAVPTAFLDDTTAARGLSFVLGLVTLSLVFAGALAIARRLELSPAAAALAATAAGLGAATSPYWLHWSLFIDIDGSLYPAVTMATVLFFALDQGRRPAVLGALLFLALWTKPTAFVFLVGGALAFAVLARRWRLAGRVGAASAASLGVFAVSWPAYAWLADVPWRFPIDFSYGGKAGTIAPDSLFSFVNSTRGFVAAAGFPLVLLALAATVRLAGRIRRGALEPHDAVLLTGLLTVGFYALVFPYTGKYATAAVPLLALPAGIELVRIVGAPPRLRLGGLLLAAVSAALLAYQWLGVGDMIAGPEARTPDERTFAAGLGDPRLVKYVLTAGALILLAVAVRAVARTGRLATLALAGGIALVPMNVGESLATRPQQQTTIIPSRETGFREAVAWLDARTSPGTLVMTHQDFAFYFRDLRVIPTDKDFVYPPEELVPALRDPDLRYVVFATGRMPAVAGFEEALETEFRLAETIGSFLAYERRP